MWKGAGLVGVDLAGGCRDFFDGQVDFMGTEAICNGRRGSEIFFDNWRNGRTGSGGTSIFSLLVEVAKGCGKGLGKKSFDVGRCESRPGGEVVVVDGFDESRNAGAETGGMKESDEVGHCVRGCCRLSDEVGLRWRRSKEGSC